MERRKRMAGAILAALALPSTALLAQSANPTQDATAVAPADQSKAKNLQTVTVTGSHIRSVDIETSQPVFTMDSAAIKATGLTSVDQVLTRMTSASTPDITPQDTLSSGSDVGGRYANLRYLGSQRTLVLVNGKRWSTSLSGLTDLSTIPVSIIDHIDVLKDGASSIYGSDAIGGVINIVTKDHFEGSQVNAYVGENGQGDGNNQEYDFTWGHSTTKSNFILNATFDQTRPMWDKRRKETRYGQGPLHPDDALGLGPYGRVIGPDGTAYVINHGPGVTANPADINDYHVFAGDPSDLYNTNHDMTFRSGTKLRNLFLQERYQLTDNVSLHATATYSSRDNSAQLAGYPFQTGADSIGNNPDPDNAGIFITPGNAYNPFPGQYTEFFRRTVELPRITWSNSRLAHINLGAEGNFQLFNHDWTWDADYTYSQNKIRQITSGNIYLPNAEKALGDTTVINGQVACASAADRAAGCVPWNILAGPGGTPQSVWNYVNAIETARQVSSIDDYSADVSGGLFDLPGGTVSLAVGVEHRGLKGHFRPDPNASAGLTTDLASAPTQGAYNTNEAYAELDVPLLRDLPGAQELGLNIASRYSHYSNFGSTTNNKYSFRWRPFTDLLVRATYAQGFRAPTISDLDGGSSQSFETYLDPCDSQFGAAATNASVKAHCAADGVPANYRQLAQSGLPITSSAGGQTPVPFVSGSNSALQPEKSITRTAGLVYSPHYVDGLDLSLDYYKIYIKNVISSVVAQDIVDYCYIDNDPTFCDRFSRTPTATSSLAAGQIISLNESLANLGTRRTEGYDIGIHYRLPETSIGSFRIASDSSYVTKNRTTSGPGAVPVNDVGIMSGEDPIYRLRSNLQADWSYKAFGASWTIRYYSGLKDICYDSFECNHPNYTSPSWGTIGMNQKGSVTFNDVQVHYTASWKGTFTVGVNNVFDKKGPYYYNVTNSGTGSPPYNPDFDIDRYFYVSYSQKF